jgi:ribulose-5-phosphate 4-epimerase/fuculose-1-phosphate aldolase
MNKRPDVMSVAHTHSEMCIVLGAARIPWKPVHNNGAMFGPEERVYEEVGLIHSKDHADRLATALEHDSALLLRSHGTIVTGYSIKRAIVGAIRLEYCARLQVLAMSIGKPYFLSREECNHLGVKINLNRFWEYHLETCGLLEGNKGKRGSKKIQAPWFWKLLQRLPSMDV